MFSRRPLPWKRPPPIFQIVLHLETPPTKKKMCPCVCGGGGARARTHSYVCVAYLCAYTCTCMCAYVCTYYCMFWGVCVSWNARVFMYVCVCVHTCVYVCVFHCVFRSWVGGRGGFRETNMIYTAVVVIVENMSVTDMRNTGHYFDDFIDN